MFRSLVCFIIAQETRTPARQTPSRMITAGVPGSVSRERTMIAGSTDRQPRHAFCERLARSDAVL
jgi:hypothetical protein